MSFNDGFNIKSVPWPPNTPVSGNSLVYNGTQWLAANVSGSGGGGSSDWTRTGTVLNPTVSGDSVLVNIPFGTAGVTVEETGAGASAVISPANISLNENLKQIDLNASVSTVKLRGDTGEGVSPVIRSVDFDDSLYTLDLQIRELSINNTVGASGEVLTSNGTGLAPTWQTIGGGTGDITAVNAGTNLTGGGSSGDVTISLSASLAGIDKIDFTTGNLANPPFQTGRLYYDVDTQDLQYNTIVNGVSMNLGQQLVVKVKNDSLATINKGKLIRISGGLGNNPTIATASWENDDLAANTLGMMMNTVAHNDFGFVLLTGVIIGVNTVSFEPGEVLYLSSSGDYTNVKPIAPKHIVSVGEVIRKGNSSVGSIFVKIQNGYELEELHNVLITSASQGDLLAWNSSDSLWKNTKTLSGSYTVTGSITASNFVGTLIGTVSSSLYRREWHVSTGSGNDITGNGTLLNPYRTLGAGIAAASTQGGDQIVLHPGTYIEDVTMGKFNTTICAAQGSNGGEINLSGTMTVSQSIAPNSSIRLYGIAVSNLIHNGTGSLYLENCKVNNTFTKATTAYFQATGCDFNKDILIVSGGLTSFQGGNQSVSGSSFLINNPAAVVTIRDSITTCSPVVISGTLGINDCAVVATSSGGPAVTSISPTSLVIMVDSTTLDTTAPFPLPTKVTIGGYFSYSNSVFNKPASTLGTTSPFGASIADFETVRVNTITGSTAQFTTITGSTVTGSTARFTTITGSNVSSSVVLLSSPITLPNQATTKAYVDSSIVTSAGFKKYGYFEIASGSYNTTSSIFATQDALSGAYVPSAATGTMIFTYDTSFVIANSGHTVSTRLLVDGVVKRGASFLSTRADHSASLGFSYPVAITSASHTYEVQWKIVGTGSPNVTMVVNGDHDQFGSLTILEYTA